MHCACCVPQQHVIRVGSQQRHWLSKPAAFSAGPRHPAVADAVAGHAAQSSAAGHAAGRSRAGAPGGQQRPRRGGAGRAQRIRVGCRALCWRGEASGGQTLSSPGKLARLTWGNAALHKCSISPLAGSSMIKPRGDRQQFAKGLLLCLHSFAWNCECVQGKSSP